MKGAALRLYKVDLYPDKPQVYLDKPQAAGVVYVNLATLSNHDVSRRDTSHGCRLGYELFRVPPQGVYGETSSVVTITSSASPWKL